MESWHLNRLKCEGFGIIILKVFILTNRLQSTCVSQMRFGEATTSEESRLEKLKLKKKR